MYKRAVFLSQSGTGQSDRVRSINKGNHEQKKKAYVQTIRQMLKKRLFLTLIWVIGAAIVAGIVAVIF